MTCLYYPLIIGTTQNIFDKATTTIVGSPCTPVVALFKWYMTHGLEIILSKPKLNHNSTQPYITLVGFDTKMTLHHHPQPPTTTHHHRPPLGTQCRQYLSCYWPDSYETLNVGSWEHLDSKCHSDICQDNICPSEICPYQEYLSCYWPDFDKTSLGHL